MGTPDSIALRKAASVSDVVVELLGGYGLIEIVLERFIVNDVVEIDQLNTLLLDELQRKIATRVDDEIALSGHSVPFQKNAYSNAAITLFEALFYPRH